VQGLLRCFTALPSACALRCKCAEEALQVLERAEHVDLVVSDIRMPGHPSIILGEDKASKF